MLKKNKWKMIISSIIILLPMIAGMILWNSLPDRMAIHWGANGEANGWNSRAFAVFAMPVFILVFHWIGVFITVADQQNKNQTEKAIGLIFWICPAVSLFSSATVYAAAFGKEFDMNVIMFIVLGLMFVIIGNYLPKCKHNFTLGIKIKWTLENKENWYATHRFGGRIWVVGGLLFMTQAFLPNAVIPYTSPVLFVILIIVPIAYSYFYHRKQVKNGTATIDDSMSRQYKRITKISMCIVMIILLFCGYLIFSGNITIQYGEDSFTIEATYWDDITVDYAEIDNIEYCERDIAGTRTFGFGSARLQMGEYQNEEYGRYTRYTYTQCDSCVVLIAGEETLVISGVDAESTKAIYDELTARIEE